jgi:hypothetical protein
MPEDEDSAGMTHRLQADFATPQGEEAYVEKLRKHISSGYLEAAEGILIADLAMLDRDLAQQCAALGRNQVKLDGWPELMDVISVFEGEGESVTGIAIGLANEPDLAFEKGLLHSPYLTLGLYTDGGFAWSTATREDILAQCASGDPQWGGHEEDVEVYMNIEGLDAINTALIHHKNRFFLRDGKPDKAPEGYVEYVLACWLRALRFHQAIAAELAEHGLPGNIPVVSGTIEMVPDVVAVHYPEKTVEPSVPAVQLGSLIATTVTKRMVDLDAEVPPATTIRQRIAAANDQAEESPPVEEKKGFFARMFGR